MHPKPFGMRPARTGGSKTHSCTLARNGTLHPRPRRAFGLLRWKLGTGGQVVETLGEWETPMDGCTNTALYKGFQAYLARR